MSETPPPPPPGAPSTAATPAAPASRTTMSLGGTAVFSLAATALIAVAVSVKEDGSNGWSRYGVWAAFAIGCAVVTLAPAARDRFGMSSVTAWRVANAGAIGLGAYWILFVLPWIEQNVGFLATLGCAAGIYAAWMAPGRPQSGRAQSF